MTSLKPTIEKPLATSAFEICTLATPADAAAFFEVPLGQLLYILYKLPDEKKYSSFEIPKKTGGYRSILAPIKGIAILQQKLTPVLYELYRVKASVHGFVREKSVLTNAREHTRRPYVLNIDLENYFGSINFGRVRGLFMASPFNMPAEVATIFAQLCTHNNSLPQGAPTSPILSNFITAQLDKTLTFLAQRYKLMYSRYADDVTFSTSRREFPRSIAYFEGNNPITGDTVIGSVLEDLIQAMGFKVNYKKVRLQISGVRQEVTGLTVNEFANVKRKFVRNIRAMLHAWKKHGLENAETEYVTKYLKKNKNIKTEETQGDYFKSVLYGKLAYLKMVRGDDDDIYMKYCLKAAELDPAPPKFIQEIKVMHQQFDVFISHASEDKQSVAEPIFNACKALGINPFLDVKYINWGDSLTEKINHALGRSKLVLAILSKNSVDKTWPSKEINAALAREIEGDQKILPLIVGSPDLSSLSLLQDKLHENWSGNAELIAEKMKALLNQK